MHQLNSGMRHMPQGFRAAFFPQPAPNGHRHGIIA
jgi:hypothetical protein